MNPESITILQIIRALTPKHAVAIIVTLSTLVSAIFLGGYKYAEKSIGDRTTKLEDFITQMKNELAVERTNASQLRAEKAQLLNKIDKTDNCTFIRNKIQETEEEIKEARFHLAWQADKEIQSKQQKEVDKLESRLALYQQQLSACSH